LLLLLGGREVGGASSRKRILTLVRSSTPLIPSPAPSGDPPFPPTAPPPSHPAHPKLKLAGTPVCSRCFSRSRAELLVEEEELLRGPPSEGEASERGEGPEKEGEGPERLVEVEAVGAGGQRRMRRSRREWQISASARKNEKGQRLLEQGRGGEFRTGEAPNSPCTSSTLVSHSSTHPSINSHFSPSAGATCHPSHSLQPLHKKLAKYTHATAQVCGGYARGMIVLCRSIARR